MLLTLFLLGFSMYFGSTNLFSCSDNEHDHNITINIFCSYKLFSLNISILSGIILLFFLSLFSKGEFTLS